MNYVQKYKFPKLLVGGSIPLPGTSFILLEIIAALI